MSDCFVLYLLLTCMKKKTSGADKFTNNTIQRVPWHRKVKLLRSVWIKTTDLNGLVNMTLVQMNCSMEREKDRKPGKQKNFCLRYWLMEVWHKRKLRKKQKNWELKRKH